MKHIKIVMTCKIAEKDIPAIFINFQENYPEVTKKESGYAEIGHDFIDFVWVGTIEEKDEEGIVKLTHKAEGIYENTSASHVHVEVCIDGKWYGRYPEPKKSAKTRRLRISMLYSFIGDTGIDIPEKLLKGKTEEEQLQAAYEYAQKHIREIPLAKNAEYVQYSDSFELLDVNFE